VARTAQGIAHGTGGPRGIGTDAYTAGMLHDVGMLVLAQGLRSTYDQVLMYARDSGVGLAVVEQEVLGGSHAAAGAALLRLWGIPESVVDAVEFHHTPQVGMQPMFTPLVAVHAAEALASEVRRPCEAAEATSVDWSHLRKLGMTGPPEAWRTVARNVTATSGLR
jgi:HD-like signal output (HDOD) protein